jgi:hypothetical protein
MDNGQVQIVMGYAIGKAVHALRADVLAELKSQAGGAVPLPAARQRIESSAPVPPSSGENGRQARVETRRARL